MKVIKIGAAWCPECVIMKPRWAEIEHDMPELKTEFFDVDENPEIKAKYSVDHIPSFIFFDNNDNETKRLRGLVEKDELINTIKKLQA
jgi:thioredoxin 1